MVSEADGARDSRAPERPHLSRRFALTTTPDKAGEAIRSLYLQKSFKVPLSHSFAAFFAERFVDLLAYCCYLRWSSSP